MCTRSQSRRLLASFGIVLLSLHSLTAAAQSSRSKKGCIKTALDASLAPHAVVFTSADSEIQVGSPVKIKNGPLFGTGPNYNQDFYFMGVYDDNAYFVPKNSSFESYYLPVSQVNLKMDAQKYPYLEPQIFPNCLSKAVAYLQEVVETKIPGNAFLSRDFRGNRLAGLDWLLYANPFVIPFSGSGQFAAASAAFTSSGIFSRPLIRASDLRSHLLGGGKALILTNVADARHLFVDADGLGRWALFSTPAKRSPENGAHAMVALGFVKSEDRDWDNVILLDPATGKISPVRYDHVVSGLAAGLALPK
jgi:hypothetical protein